MEYKERIAVEKKLIELTQEFLKNFTEISKEDAKYAFNMELPRILAKAVSSEYKFNEYTFPFLGPFVDRVALEFCEKNMQGTINMILKALERGEVLDDYSLKNIVVEAVVRQEQHIDLDEGIADMKFTTIDVPGEDISFEISNNKSGFDCKVFVTKTLDIHAEDGAMKVKKVKVVSKGVQIIELSNSFETVHKDDGTIETHPYELINITHFKHVADINSFHMLITMFAEGELD